MNNISGVRSCYGCGVCGLACGQKIIEIRLNREGFDEPYIADETCCTDCGICTDVCAYLHEDLSSKDHIVLQSYAAWSKDVQIRHKCSSGGVGFELGRYLLGKGYQVCGVRYNPDLNRAEHYMASCVEELTPSVGSKYIQSFTLDGFRRINRKDKYLITGTPCQIDSFRRYIQKFKIEEHFILVDFFCHGVPSMLLWKKYLEETEQMTGKITGVSWRNKATGWHDSWAMTINGEKTFYNSRLSGGDVFYRMFLSDLCLGKACYEKCKYKYDKSAADIRIGDLWGKTYAAEEEGVSAVVAFTEKGLELLKSCDCELTAHPFEVVAEGQMRKSPAQPFIRPLEISGLRGEKSLKFLAATLLRLYKIVCLPKRVLNRVCRIITK